MDTSDKPIPDLPEHQQVEKLRRDSQTVNHKIHDTAPFVKDVPEGGVHFATVSGVNYIYTKINGVLHRTALTAI